MGNTRYITEIKIQLLSLILSHAGIINDELHACMLMLYNHRASQGHPAKNFEIESQMLSYSYMVLA